MTPQINTAMLVAKRFAVLQLLSTQASDKINKVIFECHSEAINDEEKDILKKAMDVLDKISRNHGEYSASKYVNK